MNLLIKSQFATPKITEENALSQQSAAQGAAVGAANGPIDPELQTIVERWPGLPDALKAGILAMIDVTIGNGE